MIMNITKGANLETIMNIFPAIKSIHDSKIVKEIDIEIANDVREDFPSLFVTVYTEDTAYLNLLGTVIYSKKGRALSLKIKDEDKIQELAKTFGIVIELK